MKSLVAIRLFIFIFTSVAVLGCGGGSDGASSSPVIETPSPINSEPTGEIMIVGESTPGSVLSLNETIADSNGIGNFSYQWYLAGVPINNATTANYKITEDDVGQTITIIISYTDGDGFFESVTSPSILVSSVNSDNADISNSLPNIMFIITDDQGLDASNQYSYSDSPPITPNLDALANNGLIFENVWATPACTTTRAAILTGSHGINSGITSVPAELDTSVQNIAKYLKNLDIDAGYQTAAFGKWHLAGAGNTNENHPNNAGFDYYAGNLNNIEDYFNWEITINGVQSISTTYHSTVIADLAIAWINAQTTPWFSWVAFQAPHTPLHLPPSDLHSRSYLSGNDIDNNAREYYLASIDAMDTEIGRLIASMDEEVRNKTIFVFIGDNGSPKNVIDTHVFKRNHSKSTLYEGGIRVPMFMSGPGIERKGEREGALVNATDFFATFAQLLGGETANFYDSNSFHDLLSQTTSSQARSANYSEFESDSVTGWAIKDDTLKLIQYENGTIELFDLTNAIDEGNDLSNDTNYTDDIARLMQLALGIRGEDTQGESPLDITNQIFTKRAANCKEYVESYKSTVLDVNRSEVLNGNLSISVGNNKCIFTTNAIPHHDFNDGAQAFPNVVTAQNDQYEITATPTFAAQTTPLTLQTDNAILLNGVKVDLLAAGCFGIGNGKIGCGDINQPWRYDPMFLANGFNVDSHNAHAQSDGTYHYHGKPNAFYNDENTGEPSPVLGFAADGFPIFGPYFSDNGTIRKAIPSFQLIAGSRPSGAGDPGGSYDGAYRDDYEYVEGSGDLDECNGMTIDGVYGYYITDGFPYILSCFKGATDPTFNK